DVPIQLVLAQVVGGEQVPDSGGAGVGGAPPPPRCPAGLFAPAADGSPLPAGPWLEAERPKLVHADHHLRIARARGSFTVGDGIQVLNAGLLRGVARVFGRFPGR